MLKNVTILALLALCLAAAAPDTGKRRSVTMKNLNFSPNTITIKAGDTVVWTNSDDRDHTVIAADNSFDSGNISNGKTYEHRFPNAGKFPYACSYHPRMKGTVVVE